MWDPYICVVHPLKAPAADRQGASGSEGGELNQSPPQDDLEFAELRALTRPFVVELDPADFTRRTA